MFITTAVMQSEDKIDANNEFDIEAAVQNESNEESKSVIDIGSQIKIKAATVTEKEVESRGVFQKENKRNLKIRLRLKMKWKVTM